MGLCQDAATVIAHCQIALLCGARYAEAAFHAAHHRDMAMLPPVQDEIPGGHQHETRARLAILPGERCEVHILADGHAPASGRLAQ